jgi:perosamine synthetase
MNEIWWWRTSFGKEEICHVSESISNECLSQGTVTAEFEQRISDVLDIPYVVATTSGSIALLMSLIATGVGAGDEVIVPNRTWIATAHAPLLLGAKVIFVDVEEKRPIMDITKIEEKISKRTKAIIPVHLNGRSVEMEKVKEIAAKYGMTVIEDAAQAFYSRNKTGFLGSQSAMGCFSLSVAKLISTGQGGFIVTRDKKTHETLKLIRTHGVSDVVNPSWKRIGFNFRFTDILASIGIEQLKKLPEKIEAVKEIYQKYIEAMYELPFLKFIPVDIDNGEIPIYIEVLCKERENLVSFLADKGVQTRPFYPDLHLAPYFKNSGEFRNSKVFGEQGLFLPCGPAQPLGNVKKVIKLLRKYRA